MSTPDPGRPGSRRPVPGWVAKQEPADAPTVVIDRRGTEPLYDGPGWYDEPLEYEDEPAPAAGVPGATIVPGMDTSGRETAGRRLSGGPGRSTFAKVRRGVGALVLVLLVVVGWSAGSALAKPTSEPAAAKLAEWARDHHMGAIVSFLEERQLELAGPKAGGVPKGGFTVGGGTAVEPTTGPGTSSLPAAPGTSAGPTSRASQRPTSTAPAHPRTPIPAAIQPFDTALAGQGQWSTLATVDGLPALLGTSLAPDSVYTSNPTTVAWLDQRLLTAQLRPGSDDPGTDYAGVPSLLDQGDRSLLAAFNAGFRLKESQGGFFLNGQTARTLVTGAASMVFHRDGTVAIGQWGRDVGPGPSVIGVRQNLKLLVDAGVASPDVDDNNSPTWGYTLGGKAVTWRSGVGITRNGALLYVDGGAMSTRTLAEVFIRAGAVRAMELDINPQWTHLDVYRTAPGAPISPEPLNPQQQTSPSHYLSNLPSSRDYIAILARP